MTYAELLQKIRDYTEVDSNVLTDTICNGFIQDAEWRIALIPGQRYLNMPQPYLIIRSIQMLVLLMLVLTHKVSLNTMEIGMKM
jgi:hypothetical protein